MLFRSLPIFQRYGFNAAILAACVDSVILYYSKKYRMSRHFFRPLRFYPFFVRIHHGTVSACIVRTNAQIKTDSFCRPGRNCRYFFAFSFVKHIHLSEKSFPNFPNHLSSAIVLCSPARNSPACEPSICV